jgi:hypothetical protein
MTKGRLPAFLRHFRRVLPVEGVEAVMEHHLIQREDDEPTTVSKWPARVRGTSAPPGSPFPDITT